MLPELLEPAAVSAREAERRSRAWLARRWRGVAMLIRPEREELRNALAAALAFELVAREALAAAEPEPAWQALAAEIDAAAQARARTALGKALSEAMRRYEIPPFLFQSRIPALRADRALAAVGTREELRSHARRLGEPAARIFVRILGADSERNEVLAASLSVGILETAWIVHHKAEWSAGRLRLPMDELGRAGIALEALAGKRADPALRSLVARSVDDARAALAKGWPLVRELGPWRGRRLAVLLRWNAAALAAVEFARYDVATRPPRGGALRWIACVAAGMATTRAPFS